MKFARTAHTALTVRRVNQGEIWIGDETITENVLLFRNEVRRGLNLSKATDLNERMISDLIAEQPETIILGSGWQSVMPPRDLVFTLARKGIGFECMDTPAACRTFNILLSENRDVAAILLVT